MIRTLILTGLLIGFLATPATAQIVTPAPSPGATVMQTVGLTDITVEYSRPGKKGRTIYAKDGLVPFGELWRTGANAATKITFDDDTKVAGQNLPAGAYAILCKPGAKEWTFHFYPYEERNWTSYREKLPALAVMVPSKQVNPTVETFTIGFDNVKMASADLGFTWENTAVHIPLEVNVDERVMKNIDQVLAGPSPNDYYRAATFLHESGKDLNQAAEYIQMATKSDDPKYWHLRRESLIMADLGKTKDAIASAQKSLELAKKAGNEDYVRMNEKSIAEWSK
ncbi:MAG: DUF2911 domain-containing protein [Bacteroidota bacterium]